MDDGFYSTSIWDEPGDPPLWEDENYMADLIMQMPVNQQPYEPALLTFDNLDDAITEHLPLHVEPLLEEARELQAELATAHGMVYNYRTKMMESRESTIDFACSSGYASHYASLGLTPDFPPEFYHNLPESLGDKLERELDEMEL